MSTPDCAICLDQLYGNDQEVAVVTSCGHSFHSACIFQAHNRDQRCPVCRGPIPDRGSIARITFQSAEEPENDQDDIVFSESVDDDSVENEDFDDEDRPSDQERAYNNLTLAFAAHAIHLRRVQEEKDKISRKLSQKKRKIEDLEARIRVLEMQSSNSIRGNGRSQPSNTSPRPTRRSSRNYDDFARLYRI